MYILNVENKEYKTGTIKGIVNVIEGMDIDLDEFMTSNVNRHKDAPDYDHYELTSMLREKVRYELTKGKCELEYAGIKFKIEQYENR